MSRLWPAALLPLAVAIATAGAAPPASAKDPDPAERGLDVFVHAAPSAIGGEKVAIDLRTYGFASTTVAKPLAGATVIAAWDPESLGPDAMTAPPDVTVKSDALGTARLDMPVPPGDSRKLVLLLSIRFGEHARTRKVEVQRIPKLELDLNVPDANVVPGSRIPAWVTVTDKRTRKPILNTAVDVLLEEGDVERGRAHVMTGPNGLARAVLAIPPNVTGTPALRLRARFADQGDVGFEAVTRLRLRDETPATPRVTLRWKELQLKPGEQAHADVRLLDAADEPIGEHAFLYWVGPRGTTAPTTNEQWAKSGTAAKTNGLGEFTITAQAPRVVTALGTDIAVIVRAELEGQNVEQKRILPVGQAVATANFVVESGSLVPGAKQYGYLHVSDGEKGVAGEFVVKGDGLDAHVKTDAFGDGSVTWTVPDDIGANRNAGPCAGGVAASITVHASSKIAALARHPEPFELCVPVDREKTGVLGTSVLIGHAFDQVPFTLHPTKRSARGPGSLTVEGRDGVGIAAWAADEMHAGIDLGDMTPGLHDVTLTVPQAAKPADVTSTRILVVPRTLPKLASKVAGGRAAPGGLVDVDVALDDGHGKPITGSVTAVVIDREGGGSVGGVEAFDTRYALCDSVGAPRERCDAFLEGDPSTEGLRWRLLTTDAAHAQAPTADPAAKAEAALKATFSDVLHSLEGAVYQANTPEQLRDVRRRENGRWTFNPELMTLVTSAMEEPPETPGGEPFGLSDLVAVDHQVSFDVVARRVTRYKLFQALTAIRSFKEGENIEPDEPILKDPNAMLRRLVREGKIEQSALLDPWGGTIQFVPTTAAPTPFLSVAKGWALQAPGPDGRIGTGDDVRDPFERVVREKTPYATAMDEDELVDARWDMRVAEATVTNWEALFAKLTGTTLGHGSGTGSGQGFGNGHGSLSGSHVAKAPSLRMGQGIVTETARWTEPVITDKAGHARIRVPLGDYETTWRIALLARTDAGQSATSVVDVPAFLPLSAHLDAGRLLTVGDQVGARIVLRNRTNKPARVTLDVAADGGLALAPKEPKTITADVPAGSVRSVFTHLVANAEGTGRATVTLHAPGSDGDTTTQEMTIAPAGEARVIASTSTFENSSGRLKTVAPPGHAPHGAPSLVLESGLSDALLAALDAIDPEPNAPPDALADAMDVAGRIEKIAEARGQKWLVARTQRVAALADSYLHAQDREPPLRTRIALDRALSLEPSAPAKKKNTTKGDGSCPKDADFEAAPVSLWLEAEPPPASSGPLACFTALASKLDHKSALELARAAHAFFDRPHRAASATATALELADATRAKGAALPAFEGTRAERAIVLSALLRSTWQWTQDKNAASRLEDALLGLRDAGGGFGSSEATRDAVRALVALDPKSPKAAKVTVVEKGKKRVIDVASNARVVVPLASASDDVSIEVSGGPVVARLERPMLRLFSGAPDTTVTPISVVIDWPNDAKVGTTGVATVTYKSSFGRDVGVWTRLPLPPGVELATPVKDVTLRQGVVHIRPSVSSNTSVSLPIRFTLPGRVLIPEAETRTTTEESPRALTPARLVNIGL